MYDYAIKRKKGKQLFFVLIYSLKQINLKTLKTYIKTNLANDFICFFKSSVKVPIFLIRSQIVVSNFA